MTVLLVYYDGHKTCATECAGSSERSCERKLKENLLFLEGFFFFSSSEKLTSEKENEIFKNTF